MRARIVGSATFVARRNTSVRVMPPEAGRETMSRLELAEGSLCIVARGPKGLPVLVTACSHRVLIHNARAYVKARGGRLGLVCLEGTIVVKGQGRRLIVGSGQGLRVPAGGGKAIIYRVPARLVAKLERFCNEKVEWTSQVVDGTFGSAAPAGATRGRREAIAGRLGSFLSGFASTLGWLKLVYFIACLTTALFLISLAYGRIFRSLRAWRCLFEWIPWARAGEVLERCSCGRALSDETLFHTTETVDSELMLGLVASTCTTGSLATREILSPLLMRGRVLDECSRRSREHIRVRCSWCEVCQAGTLRLERFRERKVAFSIEHEISNPCFILGLREA